MTNLVRVFVLALLAFTFGCRAGWADDPTMGRCTQENDALVAALNSGELETAKMHCTRALRICPQAAGLWSNCGEVESRQMHLDAAREDVLTAIRINPKQVESYEALGALAAMVGDLKGARERFEQALTIDPDRLGALGNLGMVLYRERDRLRGRRVFERLLSRHANDVDARAYLGLMAMDDDDPREAVSQFLEATRLDSKSEVAWNNLSVAYAEAGQSDKAIEALRSCLAALPNSTPCQMKLDAMTGNSHSVIDDSPNVLLIPRRRPAERP